MTVKRERNLRKVLETFFEQYQIERNPTANTLSNMKCTLRKFMDYCYEAGKRRIGEITEKEIIGYLGSLQVRTSSILINKSYINLFFNFLYRKGTITSRPQTIQYKGPADTPRAPVKDFSEEELTVMMQQGEGLNEVDRVLFYLMATRPMRISEVIGLRVGDIDLEAKTITVRQSKNRKARVLSIPPQVEQTIRDLVQLKLPDDLLLDICEVTAINRLNGFFEKCGICRNGRSSHGLRHSVIMTMIHKLKVEPSVVAELAGNSTRTIYDRYLTRVPVEQQRQAEANLDGLMAGYTGDGVQRVECRV